tara:strand:+ start:197 stop:1219 length:1023 start_codon:yes stop_codon:yes gene_type:complete
MEGLDPLSQQYLLRGGNTMIQPDFTNDDQEQHKDDNICSCCGEDLTFCAIETRDGDEICTNCGIVIQSSIRIEKDWSDYKDDQGVSTNNARCHNNADLSNPFDKGALPIYPKGYKQEYIGKDGKKRSYDMSRLNVRFIPHKQKDFWKVSNLLKEACIKLGATFALESAKSIWAIVAKSDTVCRGSNRRGIIGNCLLSACCQNKVFRKQDDIADALRYKSSELTKGRKIFKEILMAEGRTDILNLSSCEETVFTKLANDIGVPRTHWKLVSESEEMYKKYADELSVLAPSSGIAGVLYYKLVQNKFKVTKTQIKDICNVCTPTLNKALKIIEKVVARDAAK